MKRLAMILALLAAPLAAQEAPSTSNEGDVKVEKPAPEAKNEAPGKEAKDASAGAEAKPEDGKGKVVGAKKKDDVKVLQPQDVPTELLRLRSKADIKAEVTVKPHHGRAAIFKGVIRNGKLIECFVGRRFVPQKNIENNRSGVRLWWIGGSSGWMFFRYTNIQSIALTGRLTAEERREILERLKAGKDPAKKAKPTDNLDTDVEKLSPAELDVYLLKNFPVEKGWDQKKQRALKRKLIIDNVPLERDEMVFVKYYNTLVKARLKALKKKSNKTEIEIEPGTESDDEQPSGDGGAPASDDG